MSIAVSFRFNYNLQVVVINHLFEFYKALISLFKSCGPMSYNAFGEIKNEGE